MDYNMPFKVLLSFAILSGLQCSTIYPSSEITVKIGEGFSTYVNSESDSGLPSNCQISFLSSQKSYDIPKFGNGPIETEFGTIEAFEESQCGAVVRNISKASEGVWKLVTTDYSQISESQFSVKILNISENKVEAQHLVGDPGTKTMFTCYNATDTLSNDRFSNCVIRDLQTGKEERACEKRVVFPESDKIHKYLCLGKVKGSISLIKQEVFVEGQSQNKERSVQQSVQHLNKSTVLSCQFGSEKSNCFAIHLKSGQIFNIENNLVGSRYSARKTNLQTGLCQLEIPHPIKESETGVWKIVTFTDYDPFRNFYRQYYIAKEKVDLGCIFNIESDGAEEMEQLRKRVSKPQKVPTFNRILTIKCEEAPYALEYCYLVSPNKTVLFNNQTNFGNSSTVGTCIFERAKITPGLWKCGFNSPDKNAIDIVQDIHIEYFPELEVKMETPTVGIKSNESFSLTCRTVVETPIKSCMFFAPNGDIYHLSDSKNKLYYGRGLDYGDCRITISTKDISKHLGVWSCSVLSYTKPDLKLYAEMIVM